MTREEAIERIKMILEEATANEDAVSYVTSDDADALDMAIEALKKEPKSKIVKMRDATHEERESIDKHIKSISTTTGVDFWNLEPYEDCVSRADLYKWADESFECSFAIKEELAKLPPVTPTHTETVTEFADRCRECGKQKKGKWIKRENIHGLEQYYQCSNCGNHCLYEYVEIGFKNAKTKYCPNCGAEMESEE